MSRKVYEVRLNDPGKLIVFRNRVVRTPVKLRVLELELKGVKLSIRSNSIRNYSINLVTEEIEERVVLYPKDLIIVKEPLIEELKDSKPGTILEKLLEDE